MINIQLERLADCFDGDKNKILEGLVNLSDDELMALWFDWELRARPKQQIPEANFNKWLINAGRGFGKTRVGAEWVRHKAETEPGCIIHLVGRTHDDVLGTMIEGESGIIACCPPWNKPTLNVNRKTLTWANGSVARFFSAEKPDGLRGPQCHYAWADELAAWQRMETWDQLMFGLRLGKSTQVIITTTPRPIPIIKELIKESQENPEKVVLTRGSTMDNKANLADNFLNELMKKYEGTKLGRQELYAEVLDDTEGALWSYKTIDKNRIVIDPDKDFQEEIQQYLNKCTQIVVALDPAATANEDSDETAIVVAGITDTGVTFIIEDASDIYEPAEWADKAIELYDKYEANYIVAETNQGGDMINYTIQSRGRRIPYKGVHASRGKQTRAEPVSALYQQGMVKHLGSFSALEDQMTTWVPALAKYSPDRMDAMVWAVTALNDEFNAKPIPFVITL